MKHLKKYNETESNLNHGGPRKGLAAALLNHGGRRFSDLKGSNDGTQVLYVKGNNDYSHNSFEREFGGTKVSDIIANLDKYKSKEIEGEEDWELEVLTFGQIDPKFVKFVRMNIEDYDQSKQHTFYLDSEIVGERR
jgi:hypothetical protein